jgi:hypothetical protein
LSELSLNQRFPPLPLTNQVRSSQQSTGKKQSGSQDGKDGKDGKDQPSNNIFAEIELLFDNDQEIPVCGGNNQLACQSLDELMIMQQLSQYAPPNPRFHGPKLLALASSINRFKD